MDEFNEFGAFGIGGVLGVVLNQEGGGVAAAFLDLGFGNRAQLEFNFLG